MTEGTSHHGSFRDPAGFIFIGPDRTIYRQINQVGKADYDLLMASGLYDNLTKAGLMVSHSEVDQATIRSDKISTAYKIIRPEPIPFISYPYEWTFAQLQDAALLTLEIQKKALEHGMILKDASAYNIQFIGKRPLFIDTLSFKVYEPGEAWEGYRQFCEHFLAPLALARYTSYDVLKLLRVDLEGISLDLVCRLLPKRARLRPGLASHLYLHNATQKKYQNSASDSSKAGSNPVSKKSLSSFALNGIVESLIRTIRSLRSPKLKTEWGDYYTFTNYSEEGFERKRELVGEMLDTITPLPNIAWDMGANNGEFSVLAVDRGIYTIAFDIDPLATERNYRTPASDSQARRMLPLVQDCLNPSPANGFLGFERESLMQRGPADVVLALALIHHLAIGRNLPLPQVAELLASLGKHVIIEFVPKTDSKVKNIASLPP